MDYKEKVIALLNSQELSKEQKEKLESIFPELSESEDERIRKGLIQYFSTFTLDTFAGLDPKKILSWLEKHDLRTWKYIVDAVWTEKEGIGQYLDSPFTEEVAKKLQKRFGNIKQSWSEEDIATISRVISIV